MPASSASAPPQQRRALAPLSPPAALRPHPHHLPAHDPLTLSPSHPLTPFTNSIAPALRAGTGEHLKVYGPSFRSPDGAEWALMLFPLCAADGAHYLSCFLYLANSKELLKEGGNWWARDVQFTCRVLNHLPPPTAAVAAALPLDNAADAASMNETKKAECKQDATHKYCEPGGLERRRTHRRSSATLCCKAAAKSSFPKSANRHNTRSVLAGLGRRARRPTRAADDRHRNPARRRQLLAGLGL